MKIQNTITIPNLEGMSEEEIKAWIESLTTEAVYANLSVLTPAIQNKLGRSAYITTATFGTPRVLYMVESER